MKHIKNFEDNSERNPKNIIVEELMQYGQIEVIKIGEVFTLLMTGKGLDNFMTFSEINKIVLREIGEQFPKVEVMKNEDNYLLIIYKK
jgi:hypothetical protein